MRFEDQEIEGDDRERDSEGELQGEMDGRRPQAPKTLPSMGEDLDPPESNKKRVVSDKCLLQSLLTLFFGALVIFLLTICPCAYALPSTMNPAEVAMQPMRVRLEPVLKMLTMGVERVLHGIAAIQPPGLQTLIQKHVADLPRLTTQGRISNIVLSGRRAALTGAGVHPEKGPFRKYRIVHGGLIEDDTSQQFLKVMPVVAEIKVYEDVSIAAEGADAWKVPLLQGIPVPAVDFSAGRVNTEQYLMGHPDVRQFVQRTMGAEFNGPSCPAHEYIVEPTMLEYHHFVSNGDDWTNLPERDPSPTGLTNSEPSEENQQEEFMVDVGQYERPDEDDDEEERGEGMKETEEEDAGEGNKRADGTSSVYLNGRSDSQEALPPLSPGMTSPTQGPFSAPTSPAMEPARPIRVPSGAEVQMRQLHHRFLSLIPVHLVGAAFFMLQYTSSIPAQDGGKFLMAIYVQFVDVTDYHMIELAKGIDDTLAPAHFNQLRSRILRLYLFLTTYVFSTSGRDWGLQFAQEYDHLVYVRQTRATMITRRLNIAEYASQHFMRVRAEGPGNPVLTAKERFWFLAMADVVYAEHARMLGYNEHNRGLYHDALSAVIARFANDCPNRFPAVDEMPNDVMP